MTAVTLKSAWRSTVGSRRSTCRSAVSSRSSIASEPLQVGALVGQRRLVELDVPLLQRRPQDHLAADADGRGLGPGGQRRHLDLEVAGRLRQARQPPAVGELLGGEGAHVEPGDRHRAALDPDLALLAGAVTAAGRVDRDAVPRRRVEDGDAGGHADAALVGGESGPVSTVKDRSTRPVPSCVPARHAGRLDQTLSRRTPASEKSGPSVTRLPIIGLPRPRAPAARGARRSSCRPTRRGRAAGRRP